MAFSVESVRLTPPACWQSAGTLWESQGNCDGLIDVAHLELAFGMHREVTCFACLPLLTEAPDGRLERGDITRLGDNTIR